MGFNLKKLSKSVGKVAKILFPVQYLGNARVFELYKLFKNRNKKQSNTFEDAGLQDKSYSPADYGVALTIGFGKFKTNGKVVYSMPEFREGSRTRREGDSTYIERTYDIDIAWKVCKGPVIGISRLWLDDVLILDVRSGTTGAIGNRIVNYSVASDGTVSFERNLAADIARESWKIYLGSDTQLPDAMMETNIGAGNVPAHRGWCYVTCSRLYLNDYQRRVPNISFEVIKSGARAAAVSDRIILNAATGAGSDYSSQPFGTFYWDGRFYVVSFVRATTSGGFGQVGGVVIQALDPATYATIWSTVVVEGASELFEALHATLDPVNGLIWLQTTTTLIAFVMASGAVRIRLNFAPATGPLYSGGLAVIPSRDEIWAASRNTLYVMRLSSILSGSSAASATIFTKTRTNQWGVLVHCVEANLIYSYSAVTVTDQVFLNYSGDEVATYSYASTIWANNPFSQWCSVTQRLYSVASSSPGYNLVRMNVSTGAVETVVGGGDLYAPGFTSPVYTIEPTTGTIVYNQYKSSSGNPHVIVALTSSGASIGTASIVDVSFGIPTALNFAVPFNAIGIKMGTSLSFYVANLFRLSSSGVAVSECITDLANEVGIAAGDLALSALSSVNISGFALEDRGPAKQALDILQRTSFFDLLQENGKVTAKKRGGASIMTIDADELAMQNE